MAHARDFPARRAPEPGEGAPTANPMTEPIVSTPLRQRAAQALGDRFLHEALDIATTKFITLRREAFGDFPEGERLRDRARAIKEATLQRLDEHLEKLVANVERLGRHQDFAATAGVGRYILPDTSRPTSGRLAVRSKTVPSAVPPVHD